VIATVLYTARILRLSEDVSMVVDMVKGREKVGTFCPSWMEDRGRIGDVGTNKSS
jgi:PII-like signaling protein